MFFSIVHCLWIYIFPNLSYLPIKFYSYVIKILFNSIWCNVNASRLLNNFLTLFDFYGIKVIRWCKNNGHFHYSASARLYMWTKSFYTSTNKINQSHVQFIKITRYQNLVTFKWKNVLYNFFGVSNFPLIKVDDLTIACYIQTNILIIVYHTYNAKFHLSSTCSLCFGISLDVLQIRFIRGKREKRV